MKVIFLKDVKKVGQRGQVKDVSDGYALNFLIPQKLAEHATSEKVASYEVQKKLNTVSETHRNLDDSLQAKKLDGQSLVIAVRTNEKGHLYKQLSPNEIVQAIQKQYGITIEKNTIDVNHSIKEIGESKIIVRCGKSSANIRLVINAL